MCFIAICDCLILEYERGLSTKLCDFTNRAHMGKPVFHSGQSEFARGSAEWEHPASDWQGVKYGRTISASDSFIIFRWIRRLAQQMLTELCWLSREHNQMLILMCKKLDVSNKEGLLQSAPGFKEPLQFAHLLKMVHGCHWWFFPNRR